MVVLASSAAEPGSMMNDGAGNALAPAFDDNRPVAYYRGRPISRDRFFADIHALAEALPDARHIINVCANRYRFTVGFYAALLRNQLTLLPPDRTSETLADLARGYRETIALVDTAEPKLPVPFYSYRDGVSEEGARAGDINIASQRTVAVVFTSGSTGKPEAHTKTWGALTGVTARTIARYGLDAATRYTVIATVPPQHMYGLESSIVLPLQHGLAMHESQPFFPADLAALTVRAPGPFVLVTAPIHLRALLNAGVDLDNVALVVSATAPLSAEAAARVETRFHTRVLEVYGSTETCVLATRRTATEAHWRLLSGLEIKRTATGFALNAPYFTKPWPMQDRLEPVDAAHFRLLGRAADMVKVGGKRASLAGLGAVLCAIEGVCDGAFFMADAERAVTPRLMAFAVAPGVDPDDLRRRLRERIDPAFMPRPLVLVAELPRNAGGKLTRAALERLAAESLHFADRPKAVVRKTGSADQRG
jgi:acyl-coenzyme A synthetase/AMP-(fatty) acid ligase